MIIGWIVAIAYILVLLLIGGVGAAIVIVFLLDLIQGKSFGPVGEPRSYQRWEFPYEEDYIIPSLFIRDMSDGHFDGDFGIGHHHH